MSSNHGDCLQQEVIRSLVKRYVAAMIRSAKTDEGLTEENFKVGALKLDELLLSWRRLMCIQINEYKKEKQQQQQKGKKKKINLLFTPDSSVSESCFGLSH